jgi:hypothetical protein
MDAALSPIAGRGWHESFSLLEGCGMTLGKQREVSDPVQFFCRHLVGLCVTYRYKDAKSNEPDRFAIHAGTLIEIANRVHFLTAGHILRNLDDARRSEKVEITSASLADTFSLGRISDHPIPFNLKDAEFFYIDDDSQGLDFGIVALSTSAAFRDRRRPR